MTTHDIECGMCGAKVGEVTLPDDASADDVARATSGYLCDDDHEES